MGEADYVRLLIEGWHMAIVNWHIAIVAALLLLISVGFLFKFVVPAIRLARELARAIGALSDIRAGFNGNVVELGEIESKAMAGPTLSHRGSEYAKTLHPQRD